MRDLSTVGMLPQVVDIAYSLGVTLPIEVGNALMISGAEEKTIEAAQSWLASFHRAISSVYTGSRPLIC
jgi:hypothetical protein